MIENYLAIQITEKKFKSAKPYIISYISRNSPEDKPYVDNMRKTIDEEKTGRISCLLNLAEGAHIHKPVWALSDGRLHPVSSDGDHVTEVIKSAPINIFPVRNSKDKLLGVNFFSDNGDSKTIDVLLNGRSSLQHYAIDPLAARMVGKKVIEHLALDKEITKIQAIIRGEEKGTKSFFESIKDILFYIDDIPCDNEEEKNQCLK